MVFGYGFCCHAITVYPFPAIHHICWLIGSDFIWDFRNLPFPSHLGKDFIKIGKIGAKIYKIGKIKAIFGLRMNPI